MNALLSLDQSLFLLINGWHSPFFDQVMFFISGQYSWVPLYFVFLYMIFQSYGKKGWWILLLVAITIALSDLGTVELFKNTVQRLRPSHEPALAGMVHVVNGYMGGQYGFVSSHAANDFALVFFLIQFLGRKYKWLTPALFVWVFLIIYSRVYLGVHYPLDVFCGGIYGSLIGYGVAKIGKKQLKIEFKE
jgi:undecaprenyl-diphosphatase